MIFFKETGLPTYFYNNQLLHIISKDKLIGYGLLKFIQNICVIKIKYN
jgi:hypothetical protein